MNARMTELRELFPIKLVGGFVAVDNHVGCLGCSWCLCRRQPLWQKVFLQDHHVSGAFASVDQAALLLTDMLPIIRAKVPIRFGHNTDAAFQWSFGEALYRRLPSDQPFIFMTRFPLLEDRRRLLQGQPNLLVKVSITPTSPSLAGSEMIDSEAVLASLASLPAANLFILLGPLTADNMTGAQSLLRRLPEGVWVDFKPLTREGIPGMSSVQLPDPEAMTQLYHLAKQFGIMTTDFFGCRMRMSLARSFYKTDERPDYRYQGVCQSCVRSDHCWTPHGPETVAAIRHEAAAIGLTLTTATALGQRSTLFHCLEAAGRGDETYLSERFDHGVTLSSVPAGSQGGSFFLEQETVLERWERTGMFPTTTIRAMAETLANRLRC